MPQSRFVANEKRSRHLDVRSAASPQQAPTVSVTMVWIPSACPKGLEKAETIEDTMIVSGKPRRAARKHSSVQPNEAVFVFVSHIV